MMSRSRIIEVESCKECPYLNKGVKKYWCIEHMDKNISRESINKIQEWCTLKYYPYYYGNEGMKDEYGDY